MEPSKKEKEMNAEEVVRALREMLPPKADYAELVCAEGFAHGQRYVWDDPEPYIISAAADLIESLQADLRHEEKVSHGQMEQNKRLRRINENLQEQLAASQRRERAAVEKTISWGTDLIECDTEAHSTFCAECGFPIADYGADRGIFCRMCGAKNISHNYVVAGPGSCRTTAERKAKVYDRLFGTWRGPQEAGNGVVE